MHSGPVLVCGNAWCLHEDLEAARSIYPEAPVLAVNGASAQVKAFAMFTLHPLKMRKWREAQEKKFGPGFTVHGAASPHDRNNLKRMVEFRPWFDYWWDFATGGGTSTWGARKLAHYMGFDLAVLCGMPLSEGGYADGKLARAFRRQHTIDHYRKAILKDAGWHRGVVSLSGWTREQFGGP